MAYKIDTTQYQLHVYTDYEEGQTSPYSNPNLFLLSDKNDPESKVESPVVGVSYYLAAKVKNMGDTTTIREMRFAFPTWVGEEDVQRVKDVDAQTTRVFKNAEKIVVSHEPIEFLHPGDYEMSVEIKKWRFVDENANTQDLPIDWPTSGPLYGRQSIRVSS